MKLETAVRCILEDCPGTRSNDKELIPLVFNFYGIYITMPFWDVVRTKWLPSIESITRCRRKIQSDCPELRPSEEMVRTRKQEESKFKAYARGEIVI